MAEPATTERPPPGGRDILSAALDDSLVPLDAPLPGPVLTGHPNEEPPVEDGVLPGEPAVPGEPTPAPPPRLKYQSHEEAERAYAEAERKMQEEAQRRAFLEREVELYRQHAALLERQAQTVDAPPQTTAPATAPAPFDPKEHFRKAYDKMAQLNPTTEDFEAQQQTVFIDALDEAFRHLSSTTALTDAQVTARIQAEIATALEGQSQQVRQQTERERIQGKLTKYATDHGLDMAAPEETNPLGGAHYHDVMRAVEQNLYPADADEDAAIAHVVNLVRERRGVTAAPTTPGSPPPNGARPVNPSPPSTTQRAQALNTPMERSGMGRPHNAPEEMDTRSFSLSEMLERSLSVRKP